MRKSIIKAALGVAIALAFSTVQAQNTRPYDPGPGGLDLLQSVFTDIGSTIDVYSEQSSAALFNPTGAGTSSSSFVAQLTFAPADTVGLYKAGSPGTNIMLFNSSADDGTRVLINFMADGTVQTWDVDTMTPIDSQAGFGTEFGFYFSSAVFGTWFSEDSLNGPSGNVQALIYEGNGDMVDLPGGPMVPLNDVGHYYVAFEGTRNDGTFPGVIDFNDVVFQMESVTPVPEPETYALLLAGLGLMGFVARRRRQRLATA